MVLTLTDTPWRQRLEQELQARNLTRLHVRVAEMLAALLATDPAPTHANVATACGASLTSVQDALRRLQQLGLVDWPPGSTANQYRLTLPAMPVVPRPELRRRRAPR